MVPVRAIVVGLRRIPMPLIPRDDPYPAYNFELTINGVPEDGKSVKGAFAEVTGLTMEEPSVENRNGSEDITVRKNPGQKKLTTITLKRGIIADPASLNWIKRAIDGEVQRAEGAISLLS